MYAIIDYSGKQFRVEKGAELRVPLTKGAAGSNITIDQVLLVGDGGKTKIGQPTVAGVTVDATILAHEREKKITVFKFKRRKGYQKKAGHRQDYTLIRINDIKSGSKKAAAKTADAKPAETQAETKKPAAKKPAAKKAPAKAAAKPKKAAPKKSATAAKKTAPKKAAPKKSAE